MSLMSPLGIAGELVSASPAVRASFRSLARQCGAAGGLRLNFTSGGAAVTGM
jgi:nucleoid-associated protein YejK